MVNLSQGLHFILNLFRVPDAKILLVGTKADLKKSTGSQNHEVHSSVRYKEVSPCKAPAAFKVTSRQVLQKFDNDGSARFTIFKSQ
jgi:hypothetical protein